MAENYVNESLQFALQAIRDEATKPLHVEIERLRALLTEWLVFANDVGASDAAGHDWLEGLRARTRASANAGDGQ
jgi:hypothetical protein